MLTTTASRPLSVARPTLVSILGRAFMGIRLSLMCVTTISSACLAAVSMESATTYLSATHNVPQIRIALAKPYKVHVWIIPRLALSLSLALGAAVRIYALRPSCAKETS